MSMEKDPELIRLAEVIKLTGWGVTYVNKLRECGALLTWRPTPRSRPWYYRSQILKILNPTLLVAATQGTKHANNKP